MGYATTYTLEVQVPPAPKPEDVIAELRGNCEEAEYTLEDSGETRESGKWYEHEEDMLKFSRQHPGLLFVLRGEGEENEDMWVKYFKDGMMQKAKAKVAFDDFDESKLA